MLFDDNKNIHDFLEFLSFVYDIYFCKARWYFFCDFPISSYVMEQGFEDLQCDVEQLMNSYSNREPENYNLQNISSLTIFENQPDVKLFSLLC